MQKPGRLEAYRAVVFVLFGGSVQQRMGSKTLAAAASRASGQQQVQVLTATNVTFADY
jgi:hypothetical protein